MNPEPKLAVEARRDIGRVLYQSRRTWGSTARARYENLIYAGIDHVADDPLGLGSAVIGNLRDDSDPAYDVRLWHLRSSIPRGRLGVKNTRHVLLYRFDGQTVMILRLLHDAMDMDAQLRVLRAASCALEHRQG